MKNLFLILFVILLAVACGKKSKPETTVAKDSLVETVDSIKFVTVDTVEITEPGYYVVVGAFYDQQLATKWADSVAMFGYDTHIKSSHNGFLLIYVKSGDDRAKALKIMEHVRERVTPRAWVYVKR